MQVTAVFSNFQVIRCENGVSKSDCKKATQESFSFLYIDKPRKFIRENFNETIV